MPSSSEALETLPNADLMLYACCVTLATLVPVALYQTGAIGTLPDPPMPIFASEHITSSKAAHPLGIPDGILGLASFSATLGLILLAKKNSRTTRLLLGGKLLLDGGMAAFNTGRQVMSFGKLCSWCTGTALAAGVMVYAGRETIHAAASLVHRPLTELPKN